MTDKEFIEFCEQFRDSIVQSAPKDTGNLAYNAIKMKMDSPRQCEIYVSGNSIKTINGYIKYGVAPYMPFTNGPWLSPRWRGRKNPNEGWWRIATWEAVQKLTNKYGGEWYKK